MLHPILKKMCLSTVLVNIKAGYGGIYKTMRDHSQDNRKVRQRLLLAAERDGNSTRQIMGDGCRNRKPSMTFMVGGAKIKT